MIRAMFLRGKEFGEAEPREVTILGFASKGAAFGTGDIVAIVAEQSGVVETAELYQLNVSWEATK